MWSPNNSAIELSAVLLAGGESRRMGRDKATLSINGEPLWHHQLELLRAANPVEVLISARADPVWRPPDSVFVQDRSPSRGPLSGIAAALTAMRGTHLLALAIDMPSMARSHLIGLCGLIRPDCGVIPRIGSRAEPLAAIYPRKCLMNVIDALSGDDHSLQHFTRRAIGAGMLRAVPVSKDEEQFYRNLNNSLEFEEFVTQAF